MVKILFMDIDGVCQTFEKYTDPGISKFKWTPETMNAMGIHLRVEKKFVKRLNKITDKTGAMIVLSSSWRIGNLADWMNTVLYLKEMGVTGFIVDRTPFDKQYKTRGGEIRAWFDKLDYPIDRFIILDDHNDMGPYVDRLIQTDHKEGLQDIHVKKAIEMLGKK